MVFWGATSAGAFTLGKTYDKENYQEIEEMLIFPILNWVKKGEFTIPTGKLNYELKLDKSYMERSKKNEGKYDIDKEGLLVLKNTNEPTGFVSGNPFPTIDSKDPKIAQKIMENFLFTSHFRQTAVQGTGFIKWVGDSGMEREIVAAEQFLYYQNRSGGPIPNPSGYLQQVCQYVKQPFDLKGTVMMAWTYDSQKTDTAFSYIPMLRRVRRVSAASRSDPFAGSDFCIDDSLTWNGKNASMTWKLVGKQSFLVPFTKADKITMRQFRDGSIERKHEEIYKGYENPKWTGAKWAPLSWIWHPRTVWVVEGTAKDPYYNYGKQILYIDEDTFTSYCKVMYDRAGGYWKTLLFPSSFNETQSGIRFIGLHHVYIAIDDNTHHASIAEVLNFQGQPDRINMTVEQMGPSSFTEGFIRQISK